eukprot:s74_g12.t1
MQVFTRWGSLPATFHTWLCWLQLEFTGLLLEMPLVEEDVLSTAESIHDDAFRVFQFVTVYTRISHDVAARLLALQIHAASPFRQSPPVPLRTSGPSAASATSSRRPLTPDAPPVETRSPMYRNQQPLPTPFRMSREQPGARAALDGQRTIPLPTACSGASSTRGERRSEYIAAPVPGIFGVAETGQRTVTRSASPQAHAPVTAELGQPYYVRSRPHTPFGRSVGLAPCWFRAAGLEFHEGEVLVKYLCVLFLSRV